MDSKLGGLIACIIYCIKNKISNIGKVIIFDNSSNKILMYGGNYDYNNQSFKIFDYNRNSMIIGRNSQFIDSKSNEFFTFRLTGMVFRGFTSQLFSFSGSIIGGKVTIILSDRHYTFECKQKELVKTIPQKTQNSLT